MKQEKEQQFQTSFHFERQTQNEKQEDKKQQEKQNNKKKSQSSYFATVVYFAKRLKKFIYHPKREYEKFIVKNFRKQKRWKRVGVFLLKLKGCQMLYDMFQRFKERNTKVIVFQPNHSQLFTTGYVKYGKPISDENGTYIKGGQWQHGSYSGICGTKKDHKRIYMCKNCSESSQFFRND